MLYLYLSYIVARDGLGRLTVLISQWANVIYVITATMK